jgi:hypothetical protein
MHVTGLTLPVPAPPGADTPSLPSPLVHARPPLRARDLSLALLGLLALGGAAALGLPASSAALRLTPSVVLVDLAALALTAPALIAVHQFLRLSAQPEQLAAALGRALIHGGRVAFGLSVVVLFFSATTNLALLLLIASLLAVGVFTSATACVELTAAERAAGHAGGTRQPSGVAPSFTLLLMGWLLLGWMIALRVGVDVGAWVLGLQGGF